MNVSALITGHETVGDHTEFVVQISCSGVVWLISRRFSDFDQLHCKLESVFHAALTARLPEKQWFGRFDPNFIAKRQAGLQAYLDALLQVYGILEDRSLQHFFEIEKNVELHTDHIRQSTQSVGSNGHVKLMSETDRWQLIVEKAEHELIDISEVPEPLEVDQARQKRAEVLAAYTATRSATVRSRPLKTVPTFWDGSTAPGPHAATSAWLRQLHGRLHEAFQTQQSIKQPSEDLIAFMPPPVDMVAAH
ncbi:hypothetical protein H310_11721 [Aphanomyces invadans]|uniref:PX domain-containing protein n=1 Tax=Aphanomyces invadans TaxID=157072 RepID=A0A024TL85_9STRA|nr:hypothetical protein H310_11721 [Aphanomyces invadans]ETV94764.1 hypothetical protein H310_11721 [Aphanomyces invadans]|eukprot:XP_008876710.1 hypothetical protein H310_11721 [Aphanomyces invadans]